MRRLGFRRLEEIGEPRADGEPRTRRTRGRPSSGVPPSQPQRWSLRSRAATRDSTREGGPPPVQEEASDSTVLGEGTEDTLQADMARRIQRIWRARSVLLSKFPALLFMTRARRPATFGDIHFVGYSRRSARKTTARWIRLASEEFDAPQRVLLFMEHFWKLKTPSLIISVTGAAKALKLPDRLAKTFGQGLSNVLKATQAWVITAGTNVGVMQVVGTALDEYSINAPLIGIAPWNIIRGANKMEDAHDAGNPTHVYDANELAAETAVAGSGDQRAELEPHHSFFLLVDQPADDPEPHKVKFGGDIRPRSNLETAAVKTRSVPTVLLVVGGGKGTFDQVKSSILEGGPVVIVVGSGQVADVLHLSVAIFKRRINDASGNEDGVGSDGPAGSQRARPQGRMAAALDTPECRAFLSSFSAPESAKIKQGIKDMLHAIALNPELIRSYDVSDAQSATLDRVILEGILADRRPQQGAEHRYRLREEQLIAKLRARGEEEAARTREQALERRMPDTKGSITEKTRAKQLMLACEWGRADIAAKVLDSLSRWTQEADTAPVAALREAAARRMVRDAQQRALVKQDLRVLRLLLTSNSVPVVKAAQLDMFALYSVQHRFGLFRSDARLQKALEEVRAPRRGHRHPQELDLFLEPLEGATYGVYRQTVAPFIRKFSHMAAAFVDRSERVTNAHVFLWAVLMGNKDLADLLLDRTKQPLRLALVGAALCSELANVPDVEAETFVGLQVHLEDTAIEILDRASADKDVAYALLVRGSERWGGLCPLELAVDLGLKSFLAHRTVQVIVGGEWWFGRYPSSRACVSTGAGLAAVMAQALVPFARFTKLYAIETDDQGIPRPRDPWAASDHGRGAGGGWDRQQLVNNGAMRLAVSVIALHSRHVRSIMRPFFRAWTVVGGRRAPAGSTDPVSGARRRQSTRMLRGNTEDQRLPLGTRAFEALYGFRRRHSIFALFHLPVVKFMLRFAVYVCYLVCFITLVNHQAYAPGTSTGIMRFLGGPWTELSLIRSAVPGDEDYQPVTQLEVGFAIFSLAMFVDEIWQLIMAATANARTGRPTRLEGFNLSDWIMYPAVLLSSALRMYYPAFAHVHALVLSIVVYVATIRLVDYASYYRPVGLLMHIVSKMLSDVVRGGAGAGLHARQPSGRSSRRPCAGRAVHLVPPRRRLHGGHRHGLSRPLRLARPRGPVHTPLHPVQHQPRCLEHVWGVRAGPGACCRTGRAPVIGDALPRAGCRNKTILCAATSPSIPRSLTRLRASRRRSSSGST